MPIMRQSQYDAVDRTDASRSLYDEERAECSPLFHSSESPKRIRPRRCIRPAWQASIRFRFLNHKSVKGIIKRHNDHLCTAPAGFSDYILEPSNHFIRKPCGYDCRIVFAPEVRNYKFIIHQRALLVRSSHSILAYY